MKLAQGVCLALTLGAPVGLWAGSGLIKAAGRGDLTGIRQSLAAGEKINAVDSDGWSALMWAVYYRQLPAVGLLLDEGADPNLQSSDERKSFVKGTTALILAANDCNEEAVRILLQRHAKQELANEREVTAESCARARECTGVLEALGLQDKADPLDALRKEIEAGKDINAPDANGWPPLLWAVYNQDLPAVKLLLEKGADPNRAATKPYETDESGATALMMAAKGGLDGHVQILLQKNANRDAVDANGKTAADYARANGYLSILTALGVAGDAHLEELLQAIRAGKRKVDQAEEDGWTPLLLAVFQNDIFAAKALLKLGADPNLASKTLLKIKPTKDPDPKGTKTLLESAGDSYPKGTTALMIASGLNAEDLVVLLLQKKAERGLKDDAGNTAESYAIQRNSWAVQDVFLDRSPLKRSYSKLVIAPFTVGARCELKADDLVPWQEKAIQVLSESKAFERVENASAGQPYDASTLIVKTEVAEYVQHLRLVSPRANLVIRLVDASSGNIEREQGFHMTTDIWPGSQIEQNTKFREALGPLVAEYSLIATGKATPHPIPSRGGQPDDLSMMGGVLSRHPYPWQWVQKIPSYPTFRVDDFKLSMLRDQRVAIWPFNTLEMDEDVQRAVTKIYGTKDEFLNAFSGKWSARWLRLVGEGSLGVEAVHRILAGEELKPWLDPRRLLPWANARLIWRHQMASGIEALAGRPEFQGIRYLIVPHHAWICSHDILVVHETRSRMGLAVLDLAQKRLVWDGAVFGTGSATFKRPKVLIDNENLILENLEAALRGLE